MTKLYILREIKRTAQANGGNPLQTRPFESEQVSNGRAVLACFWLGGAMPSGKRAVYNNIRSIDIVRGEGEETFDGCGRITEKPPNLLQCRSPSVCRHGTKSPASPVHACSSLP